MSTNIGISHSCIYPSVRSRGVIQAFCLRRSRHFINSYESGYCRSRLAIASWLAVLSPSAMTEGECFLVEVNIIRGIRFGLFIARLHAVSCLYPDLCCQSHPSKWDKVLSHQMSCALGFANMELMRVAEMTGPPYCARMKATMVFEEEKRSPNNTLFPSLPRTSMEDCRLDSLRRRNIRRISIRS